MSKDSPFHLNGSYTTIHPSSKQILDYNESKRRQLPRNMIDLSPERQVEAYNRAKVPKMFTSILNQGMEKEMQIKLRNHFNVGLKKQVKRVLSLQR